MLEIAHVKENHSILIILHVYPPCKWLQGALRLFMPGCDKNKAADDCSEKSSGAESLMVQGARRSFCHWMMLPLMWIERLLYWQTCRLTNAVVLFQDSYLRIQLTGKLNALLYLFR